MEYIKKLLSDGQDPSFGRHGAALCVVTGLVLLCLGKVDAGGVALGSAAAIFSLGKVTEKQEINNVAR